MVIKILLYSIGGLLLFVALYFGADAILSRISTNLNIKSMPPQYEVYVLSNGVHTDIVMPIKSDIIHWDSIFSFSNTLKPDSSWRYVAIGWGDKGFYLNTPEWKDLTAKTAFVAATGIGETALHVTYYNNMKEDSLCYKIRIEKYQFEQLKSHVLQSLDYDSQHKPILINTKAQYGNSDAFYEAKGAYSMFYSCNTWTNQGLKRANMPSGIWTVFDKGILRHYGYGK